ncbi:hypothetical protein KCU78_g8444, partial [Aureobasidium melanogenum]
TAAGIPTWSPTVVLICRSTAYVWQSGRDAQFSADCGHNIVFELLHINSPRQLHTQLLASLALRFLSRTCTVKLREHVRPLVKPSVRSCLFLV